MKSVAYYSTRRKTAKNFGFNSYNSQYFDMVAQFVLISFMLNMQLA